VGRDLVGNIVYLYAALYFKPAPPVVESHNINVKPLIRKRPCYKTNNVRELAYYARRKFSGK
jgi:hypothetical protein